MNICNVPHSCITIITPYKGQQSTITKSLREKGLLPRFSKDRPPTPGSTITVSTVDRYQGDENDIVILSLVRASAGNRFLNQPNRFIVAVSRARLGFYVIGSKHAVAGGDARAWKKFVEHLHTGPFPFALFDYAC